MNLPPLNYSLTGPEKAPLLILLHGFMGSAADWTAIAAGLPRFRCLAIDLPGHGANQWPLKGPAWDFETSAAAIMAIARQVHVGRKFILGYSMGGRLALYLAIRYPADFDAAVLAGASPGLADSKERQQRRENDAALADRLRNLPFNEFLRTWYDLPLFRSLKNHPGYLEMLQRRLKNDPLRLAKSLRDAGTGSQPPLWSKLPRNKIPLLLVVGEKDAKFRSVANAMENAGPAIFQQIIPHCGHNVCLENTRDFCTITKDFLEPFVENREHL